MERAKVRLQQLLHEAIAIDGAVKGTLQRYCRKKNQLEIVASEGFSPEFLVHFKDVKPFDSSCCGRAFGVGSIIIISDIEQDTAFRPNLAVAREAGFRAVKSVPIFDAGGQKVGVLSTQFKAPKWNWDIARLNPILSRVTEVFEEHPVLTQD